MMPSLQILQGDTLSVLKTLASDSVHCVVSSPPFWGLRDYGTAQWEGGDPACDHKGSPRYGSSSTLRNDGRAHSGPYDGDLGETQSELNSHPTTSSSRAVVAVPSRLVLRSPD